MCRLGPDGSAGSGGRLDEKPGRERSKSMPAWPRIIGNADGDANSA